MITFEIDKKWAEGKSHADLVKALPHIPESQLKEWHDKNGSKPKDKPKEEVK